MSKKELLEGLMSDMRDQVSDYKETIKNGNLDELTEKQYEARIDELKSWIDCMKTLQLECTEELRGLNTVDDFFEKVFLNEYHNIRIKSSENDQVICEFDNHEGMQRYEVADKAIKEFATDWKNKIYILWI